MRKASSSLAEDISQVRSGTDGERPVEIAQGRGHAHLLEVLAVREPSEPEQRTFAAWDRYWVS